MNKYLEKISEIKPKYTFVTGYAGSGKSTTYPDAICLDGYLKKLLKERGGDGSYSDRKDNGLRAIIETHPEGGIFEGGQISSFNQEELLKHKVVVTDPGIFKSSIRALIRDATDKEHLDKYGWDPMHNIKYNIRMQGDLERLRSKLEKSAESISNLYEEAKKDKWLPELDQQISGLKKIPIIHQGKVVGFITLDSSSFKGIKVPVVDSIYVTPAHRNKGLATKAILDTFSGKGGLAYIEPENLTSIHTFEKAGFTKHKKVIGNASGREYWSMVN